MENTNSRQADALLNKESVKFHKKSSAHQPFLRYVTAEADRARYATVTLRLFTLNPATLFYRNVTVYDT